MTEPGRRFLGVDLAWGTEAETGLVALDDGGRVVEAGWTRGVDATAQWLEAAAGDDAVVFVDAPIVVDNPDGQRLCETHVGQRYGRWKVSANSTNLASPRLAGVALAKLLVDRGWLLDDGLEGPSAGPGRRFSECYPYTTLVGLEALGYDERPLYKRKPKAMSTAAFRPARAAACDELIRRVQRLASGGASLDLKAHPTTAALALEPSPTNDRAYKHREDLLDAAIAAWTALIWSREGTAACQVLGPRVRVPGAPAATIIAPARPEQRRPSAGDG